MSPRNDGATSLGQLDIFTKQQELFSILGNRRWLAKEQEDKKEFSKLTNKVSLGL